MAALTAVLVALAVASALAAAAAIVIALRRSREAPRLEQAVEELAARLEAMSEALERAQEEGRRNLVLGELAGSIDLDEVLSRTLDAVGALQGVDAAVLAVEGQEGGDPLVVALGLTTEEVDRYAVGRPPYGSSVRALSVMYEPDSGIGEGLAAPVRSETGPIGLLTMLSRAGSRSFGDDDLRELELLAQRAGPAIENARRFREARQLADLDALTGLHNRRYFHETLAREVARAHRYERKLALIIFDLDDFKEINDRIGHLAGDGVLAEIAERVRDVVRSADIACRVGGDEFAVILPESTIQDADQLARRLQAAIASRALGNAGRVRVSAGMASLEKGDDAIAFFQRADDALYRAKEAGKGTVMPAAPRNAQSGPRPLPAQGEEA